MFGVDLGLELGTSDSRDSAFVTGTPTRTGTGTGTGAGGRNIVADTLAQITLAAATLYAESSKSHRM